MVVRGRADQTSDMAITRVLSTRAVTCVDCGDPERLLTVTAEAVISRCYVCGDLQERAHAGTVVAAGRGGGARSGGAASREAVAA